ncbi:transposase family protein [Candidatus Aerophobetes bacterium]|nr:transposase family protein [Candidatus Aerophobetes bacterium]
MPYRSIDTERKVKLILEHLKGARICSLAREYGVNEDSIHLWKNKVLEALLEILSPGTPGPRARSRVQILEEKLEGLQKKYEKLSQLSQITVSAKTPSLLEERPSRCPECGEARIWKNGTYQVTGERTSRSLKLKEKGVVQRFRCSECGVKLYLVKKKSKMKSN